MAVRMEYIGGGVVALGGGTRHSARIPVYYDEYHYKYRFEL